MYSAGRQGQTAPTGPGQRRFGNRQPRKNFRRRGVPHQVDHIYAVGDVIGFPSLAATSMEQGRLAAYHAFGEPTAGMISAAADRDLHDPGAVLRRRHRSRAHQRLDRLRGRRVALPRAGPRPDRRRLPRHAQTSGRPPMT